MTLVAVKDLIGKDIAGKTADVACRYADGSPQHPHAVELRSYIVSLKEVRIKRDRGEKWLEVKWDGRKMDWPLRCGFSGRCIEGKYFTPLETLDWFIRIEESEATK